MNEFHTASAGVPLYRQHGVMYRHLAHRQPCAQAVRTDSSLELHVHFCIQAGYHADNPPWGLSPGCNRTQFTRTHTSEVSHRRDHATARTHPHAPQGRQLATISLKHVTGSLPAPASGSGSQGARPFAATASVPFVAPASSHGTGTGRWEQSVSPPLRLLHTELENTLDSEHT